MKRAKERLTGLGKNTLFFLYKNLFYKNVEAEIDADFKNMLRTYPS